MADVFSKAKRSEVMSRIRSRGNRDTELALARLLRAHKITGWRRHKELRSAKCGRRMAKGSDRIRHSSFDTRHFRVRPDFVFAKLRMVIFVDGCFWHGCPKHATKPRNNRTFWRRKLQGNKARDRLVNRALRRAGWRVIRIWEHELQKRGVRNAERGTTALVRRIQRVLVSD